MYIYDRTDLTAIRTKATLSGLDAGYRFGSSVTTAGDTLAGGAGGDDDQESSAGVVYVHNLTDLTAAPTKLPPTVGVGDRFGGPVAATAKTLPVGHFFDDDEGTDAGAVCVFELSAQCLAWVTSSVEGAPANPSW